MKDKLHETSYSAETQNLLEIIEVAKQISSGLDVEYITKNVFLILSSKYKPEFLAFLMQNDFDDLSPLFQLRSNNEFKKLSLNFPSITPLVKFFDEQEFNQISFQEFCELFDDEIIKDELKKFKPEFIIPLKSNKNIHGIYLQGKKINNSNYSLEDIQYCVNIVSFASISFENARLFREATVDRMTKLYTHHQFLEKLNIEIKKGLRYGNIFSLIMFDIDHFKQFNDKYGHLQGDVIIKEIAKILREQTRDVDIAARYGGEEFAILLPEINVSQAFSAAERIRKVIESHDFPAKKGKLNVTISAGVAEFHPDYVKYNEDVIDFADQALYKSKENGRNRVTITEL